MGQQPNRNANGTQRRKWPRGLPLITLLVVTSLLVAWGGTHAWAQDVEPRIVARIERPGQHHQYVLKGAEIGVRTAVGRRITIIGTGTGCEGSAPLEVSLHNPEGRWIRTFPVTRGRGAVIRAPKLPGDYILDVHAVRADCSGLDYVVEAWGGGGAGGDIDGSAALCRVRHVRVVNAERTVRRLRAQLRKVSAGARPRYRGYLRTAQARLIVAKQDERKACD